MAHADPEPAPQQLLRLPTAIVLPQDWREGVSSALSMAEEAARSAAAAAGGAHAAAVASAFRRARGELMELLRQLTSMVDEFVARSHEAVRANAEELLRRELADRAAAPPAEWMRGAFDSPRSAAAVPRYARPLSSRSSLSQGQHLRAAPRKSVTQPPGSLPPQRRAAPHAASAGAPRAAAAGAARAAPPAAPPPSPQRRGSGAAAHGGQPRAAAGPAPPVGLGGASPGARRRRRDELARRSAERRQSRGSGSTLGRGSAAVGSAEHDPAAAAPPPPHCSAPPTPLQRRSSGPGEGTWAPANSAASSPPRAHSGAAGAAQPPDYPLADASDQCDLTVATVDAVATPPPPAAPLGGLERLLHDWATPPPAQQQQQWGAAPAGGAPADSTLDAAPSPLTTCSATPQAAGPPPAPLGRGDLGELPRDWEGAAAAAADALWGGRRAASPSPGPQWWGAPQRAASAEAAAEHPGRSGRCGGLSPGSALTGEPAVSPPAAAPSPPEAGAMRPAAAAPPRPAGPPPPPEAAAPGGGAAWRQPAAETPQWSPRRRSPVAAELRYNPGCAGDGASSAAEPPPYWATPRTGSGGGASDAALACGSEGTAHSTRARLYLGMLETARSRAAQFR